MAKFSKFSQCGGGGGGVSGTERRVGPGPGSHWQALPGLPRLPSATHWLESGSCSPRPLYSVRCTVACTMNVRMQHVAEMKCFNTRQSSGSKMSESPKKWAAHLVFGVCLESSMGNKPTSFVNTPPDETEGCNLNDKQ